MVFDLPTGRMPSVASMTYLPATPSFTSENVATPAMAFSIRTPVMVPPVGLDDKVSVTCEVLVLTTLPYLSLIRTTSGGVRMPLTVSVVGCVLRNTRDAGAAGRMLNVLDLTDGRPVLAAWSL